MTGLDDIAAERRRHIEVEGFGPERDEQYRAGQLAMAAACYAIAPYVAGELMRQIMRRLWPWTGMWWKPSNGRRDLVKAGALIVAEIDRLDAIAMRHGCGPSIVAPLALDEGSGP